VRFKFPAIHFSGHDENRSLRSRPLNERHLQPGLKPRMPSRHLSKCVAVKGELSILLRARPLPDAMLNQCRSEPVIGKADPFSFLILPGQALRWGSVGDGQPAVGLKLTLHRVSRSMRPFDD
jgi:hypothetical protein